MHAVQTNEERTPGTFKSEAGWDPGPFCTVCIKVFYRSMESKHNSSVFQPLYRLQERNIRTGLNFRTYGQTWLFLDSFRSTYYVRHITPHKQSLVLHTPVVPILCFSQPKGSTRSSRKHFLNTSITKVLEMFSCKHNESRHIVSDQLTEFDYAFD